MKIALAALVLIVSLQPGRAPGTEGVQPLLERVVVLGASLSSGYGMDRELATRVSFAAILDEVVQAEHGKIVSHAQPLFFADPGGYGRLMIDAVVERDPTLALAIDFPFWFGYGSLPEEQRLSRLNRGLELLAELKCPVVVGNLPDMRAAQGKLLSVLQIPERETLALLNARISAWADERPTRMVVDLATYAEQIRDEVDIDVGSGWKGERAGELIQDDELHPSLVGATLIAIMTGEVLSAGLEELAADSFDADIEAIVDRLEERYGTRTASPAVR